jgi:hypothetical protein
MSDRRSTKDRDTTALFEEGFGAPAAHEAVNGQAPEEAAQPPQPQPTPPQVASEVPETRRPGRRPAQPPAEPVPAEPMMDDLDMILTAPTAPLMLKMLAGRIKQLEALSPGNSILALDTRLRHLEPVVQQMAQQRAVAEVQMERQIRSAALDLAIKALTAMPEADRSPDTISAYADAFTQYMKVGDH